MACCPQAGSEGLTKGAGKLATSEKGRKVPAFPPCKSGNHVVCTNPTVELWSGACFQSHGVSEERPRERERREEEVPCIEGGLGVHGPEAHALESEWPKQSMEVVSWGY